VYGVSFELGELIEETNFAYKTQIDGTKKNQNHNKKKQKTKNKIKNQPKTKLNIHDDSFKAVLHNSKMNVISSCVFKCVCSSVIHSFHKISLKGKIEFIFFLASLNLFLSPNFLNASM